MMRGKGPLAGKPGSISRRRFTCALAAVSGTFSLAAKAGDGPTRQGVHGMVLFAGAPGLFASHLPMFHRPHDVQVVLRLRVADAALDAQLRTAVSLAGRGTGPFYWSIEPERFDLDRLAPSAHDALRTFDANVHEGHFERGGALRHAKATFLVEDVALFNPLDPTPRKSDVQAFVCLGDGPERFVVKLVDQRPDVDLIGRMSVAAKSRGPRTFTVPGSALAAPDSAKLRAAMSAAGLEPAGDMCWLYSETGDLA